MKSKTQITTFKQLSQNSAYNSVLDKDSFELYEKIYKQLEEEIKKLSNEQKTLIVITVATLMYNSATASVKYLDTKLTMTQKILKYFNEK